MSRVLAWLLVAVAFAALIARFVIVLATGGSLDAAAREVAGVGLIFSLAFPVLGALVLRAGGSRTVAWLMTFIGVTIAVHALTITWSRVALQDDPGSLPWGDFLTWVSVWLWMPGWILATLLLPVVLPDGRLQGRRRLLAWTDGVVTAVIVAITAAVAWPLRGINLLVEPDHHDPALKAHFDALTTVYAVSVVFIAVLAVFSLGSLVVRYRRATGDLRRQIAWVVYGAALAVVLSIIGSFPAFGGFMQVFEALALVGGIAVAMFRYNLYDLGVVVNRTLVYGGLTAILGGAYLASVLLLQLILSPSSDLAIAGSTLAVAALFRPARGRIQTLVDRRFYRRKYDAQRTLEAFSARLRDEVALEALGAELRGVVTDTMQPAHVTLWLVRR